MPASSGMSLVASTTVSGQLRSSRSANILVNTGGMCCTTTTGTGRLPGSLLITRVSASGPPVEQPTATTSTLPPTAPRAAAGGRPGPAVAGPAAPATLAGGRPNAPGRAGAPAGGAGAPARAGGPPGRLGNAAGA